MTQVALVDVQPSVEMETAIKNLIQFKEVGNGNIGLEKLYELVGCESRMIERVWLGELDNDNELQLVIDEEGTFGQWTRGIKIKNQDGYEHTLFGNLVFVKATPEGDWIGWDSEREMADAIRPYIAPIKFFEVAEQEA